MTSNNCFLTRWHRKLRFVMMPTLSPVVTKLASWQTLVFCGYHLMIYVSVTDITHKNNSVTQWWSHFKFFIALLSCFFQISPKYVIRDNILTWICYWPFVNGSHMSLVDSPNKRPVMLSFHVLFDASWKICWTNSQFASDRRHYGDPMTSL